MEWRLETILERGSCWTLQNKFIGVLLVELVSMFKLVSFTRKKGSGSRAVKWADGPFNRKNFRVRFLIFSVRLNPSFFGPDRISPRLDRASPRLIGWPGFLFFLVFSFLLIMKNTFNFNTNRNFFTSFLKSFFFFLSILKKLLMNNNIFSISTI